MLKSNIRRICPECGRELETCFNKFHIEMWPTHRITSAKDMTAEDYIALYRERLRNGQSYEDFHRTCLNSATPVLE